ncbi:MAG: hypothetical protein JNM36_00170 [Chitinophagales bacterium]|nr:hypothetical protein [Chitinophagales bacterium]
MAQIYPFTRNTEDDLIIVAARAGNSLLDLVLDTGVSDTFINFGVLIKERIVWVIPKGLYPLKQPTVLFMLIVMKFKLFLAWV